MPPGGLPPFVVPKGEPMPLTVCPDCGNTAPDQRAWAKNGRCKPCTRQIYRDRRRRREPDERT